MQLTGFVCICTYFVMC